VEWLEADGQRCIASVCKPYSISSKVAMLQSPCAGHSAFCVISVIVSSQYIHCRQGRADNDISWALHQSTMSASPRTCKTSAGRRSCHTWQGSGLRGADDYIPAALLP
jgi:hypothetical protein